MGVEDEYWRLPLGGLGTGEACRLLGIGRKTGYRWRAERGDLPPLRLSEAVRGRRYLSRFERQRIASMRAQGLGVREIARRLGRSPSTISRELRRNVGPHDGGAYDADLADARARERAGGDASAGSPPTPSSRPSSKRSSSSTLATERHHVWMAVAPVTQSRRPLVCPTQVEGLLTHQHHRAVGAAGHDGRDLPGRHGDQSLVQ